MSIITKFYEKTKGALWGLIFIIVSLVGLGIALILVMTSSDYMFHKNFISDLSNASNGANIVYIIWMILMGITGLLFCIYYWKFLVDVRKANKKLAFASLLFMMDFSLLIILITIFPLDYVTEPASTIHIILAIALFILGAIGFILTGITEIKAKTVPLVLPITGFIAALFMMTFAILLSIGTFTSFGYHTANYIIQWIGFVLIFGWFVVHTMCMYRVQILEPKQALKAENS